MERQSMLARYRSRPAVRRGLVPLLFVVAWSVLALADAPAAPASPIDRLEIVRGVNLPQPPEYTDPGMVKKVIFNMADTARIPGFPVRQHPVNAGLFDTGCAHCHRLAGPIPPGSGAPPDVFDVLPPVVAAAPPPPGFTRLTDSPDREEFPSWSPDGTTIVYEVRDAEGSYDLWRMDADGANAARLTDHASAGWAAWHPLGHSIAYWASDEAGSGNIWLVDVQTGTTTQLTRHRMTAWPQWSPDGSRLAYQATDDAGAWSLRMLDLATGEERVLSAPGEVLPSRPLWSPDGSELLYQTLIDARFVMVRSIFPVGRDARPDYEATPVRVRLPTTFAVDLGAAPNHAAWRPDGSTVAFLMYDLRVVAVGGLVLTYKTWLVSPDGARPTLLVPEGTVADRSPTWQPAGTWLAQWSWRDDGTAGVWLAEVDGARRIDLTAVLGGDALYPAWSPDGSKIAFASNRDGTFDIWVADLTVAAPEVLVGGPVQAGP